MLAALNRQTENAFHVKRPAGKQPADVGHDARMAATFNEMLKNPLKNTGTILKSFAGLDSKTRNMLLKTIFAFVKSAKNNFSDITGGQKSIEITT